MASVTRTITAGKVLQKGPIRQLAKFQRHHNLTEHVSFVSARSLVFAGSNRNNNDDDDEDDDACNDAHAHLHVLPPHLLSHPVGAASETLR